MLIKILILLIYNLLAVLFIRDVVIFDFVWIKSLYINMVLFVCPGAAWSWLFKRLSGYTNTVIHLVLTVFFSLIICFVSLLLHHLLHISVTITSHLLVIGLATNIGVIWGKPLPGLKQFQKVLIMFCLVIHILACLFSTYTGDTPFEDSDLDLQGTAYGLIHSLNPRMLSDRKTIFNFSHPLLSAFCAANSILVFGDLDNLKYYFDASIYAEKVYEDRPVVGRKITLVNTDNKKEDFYIVKIKENEVLLDKEIHENIAYDYGKVLPANKWIEYDLIKKARIWHLITQCYQKFLEKPYLLSTRNPQFLFTALTFVVMAFLVLEITGSRFIAILSSVFYLAIPEVFIAHSVTNYTAAASFLLISAAYLYCVSLRSNSIKKRIRAPLFITGFLCAATNHKTIIFFAAVLAKELICNYKVIKQKSFLNFIKENYLLTGFLIGTSLYWTYGMLINMQAFVLDHACYHLLNRIFHQNPFGYEEYFSIAQLWDAYSSNIGRAFFIIGIFCSVYFLKKLFVRHSAESTIALWFFIGATAFTIVDHRETVHLMYVTPALIALSTKWIMNIKGARVKTIFASVMLFNFILNIRVLIQIMRDKIQISSILTWL